MKYTCKYMVKLAFRGLLSHFGILILIILYLIGGGYLFILLESQNEINSCYTSFNLLIKKINDTALRGMSIGNAGYNTSKHYQELYDMLFNFTQDIYRLGISPLKDCTTLGQPDNLPNWNLANSIFFCATIITTIGYGNIYPLTTWGRIVCIIYAFIGIPLMLMFLGKFGDILADIFRSVYINLCCCRCFLMYRLKNKMKSTKSVRNFSANNSEPQEEQDNGMIIRRPAKMMPDEEFGSINTLETDEDEFPPVVDIPLTVVTGFLIFYLYIGAIIFKIWESWDFEAALYFSFITASTIGFGDLYPAKETIGTSAATVELIIAAIYCVSGLAILSMCFTLIKDEIVEKILWFGKKLGVTKQNHYNTDDLENSNDDESSSNVFPDNLVRRRSMKYANQAYETFKDTEDSNCNIKTKAG